MHEHFARLCMSTQTSRHTKLAHAHCIPQPLAGAAIVPQRQNSGSRQKYRGRCGRQGTNHQSGNRDHLLGHRLTMQLTDVMCACTHITYLPMVKSTPPPPIALTRSRSPCGGGAGGGGWVSVHKISEGIRANANEWTHHELAAASIRHRNRAILSQHTYKLLFQPHHLHESSDT